ncbi:BTB/POZ domain-containing protein 6-B-like [Paramacrobiotus metropolitanus]|uniref:BTB/POZ domain-containing protein 6-B-like n=1 Tax=Paramacrobiotus metropolitanus TaxID=2943436 RepID=UPI002445B242|nr:BTB/POZ domain-containing protein 6-B-like [Paramacrobiotus metropolitanus]
MADMSANSSASIGLEPSALRLASSMRRSLSSGEFSDVQFSVGRQFGPAKCFHVHKYVLCLRSSVFGAMIYGNLPERCDQPINIPDIIPDAFGNMLNFLYTDVVENLNVENVVQTLTCADKYDLPLLVEMCRDFISTHLNVDNCLTILENAIRFHADVIIERCLQFIDQCVKEVFRSEKFVVVDQKAVVRIFQRDTLSATENDIYLAAERWSLEACKANNFDPSAANRRQMLGEALFLVRFPLLTNAQLADGPIKSGLLLQSEVQDLFQHRFATAKPSLSFPALPRTHPGFRVGELVFQNKELVFIHRSPQSTAWCPAVIIGVQQGEFVYEWRSCFPQGTGTAAGAKIVRASDVLKPGLVLFAKIESLAYALYCRADGDQHVVKRCGQEYTVGIDHLELDDSRLHLRV